MVGLLPVISGLFALELCTTSPTLPGKVKVWVVFVYAGMPAEMYLTGLFAMEKDKNIHTH
jgi:hypothetical protein